jgi:hypothetical protein
VEAEEQVEEKVEEATAEEKTGKKIPKPDIDTGHRHRRLGGFGTFLDIATYVVRSAVAAADKAEENGTLEKIGSTVRTGIDEGIEIVNYPRLPFHV